MTGAVGLQPEQMQALISSFTRAQTALEQADRNIKHAVGTTWWQGEVASRFRSEWASKHSPALLQQSTSLASRRRELTRQLQQQIQTSNDLAGGTTSAPETSGHVLVASTVGGVSGSWAQSAASAALRLYVLSKLVSRLGQLVAAAAVSNRPGSPLGMLPDSNRGWHTVQERYDAEYENVYHLNEIGGPNGIFRYQCLSYAWFRMRELGYKGPQVKAHGGQLAGKLNGSPTTLPKLGAVMSYGDGDGHVVIAEEIIRTPDGRLRVRVSEMNRSGREHAIPDDYHSDRWLTQVDGGKWTSELPGEKPGKPMKVTVFNPQYP